VQTINHPGGKSAVVVAELIGACHRAIQVVLGGAPRTRPRTALRYLSLRNRVRFETGATYAGNPARRRAAECKYFSETGATYAGNPARRRAAECKYFSGALISIMFSAGECLIPDSQGP
jgi:hypothetical protein